MWKKLIICCTAILTIGSLLLTGACSSSEQEETTQQTDGFAIYLTKDNVPPNQMKALSHVNLVEEPLISQDDIISYDAGTHKIVLTQEAYTIVEGLGVPTSGKSFMVCLNNGPVYSGAFWTGISSQSFDGITIMVPLMDDKQPIQIQRGYPASGFFSGNDPRNDPSIMESLDKAGKLINTNVTTFIDELPDSMKGYELYSWDTGEEWHFRLITGTNRNKTIEEVVSGEDTVTSMVSVHVIGEETLESLLGKLPAKEDVIWMDRITDGTISDGSVTIDLPDDNIVRRIQAFCDFIGVNLVIPAVN